jgi:hypothetical protein
MLKKRVRNNLSLIMLLAFLVNAILPSISLATIASNSAQNDPSIAALQSVVGDRFLICTPNGNKRVSWAELSEEDSDQSTSPRPQCALCTLPTFGTTAALIGFDAFILPTTLVLETVLEQPETEDHLIDVFRYRGAFSRAPPLSL